MLDDLIVGFVAQGGAIWERDATNERFAPSARRLREHACERRTVLVAAATERCGVRTDHAHAAAAPYADARERCADAGACHAHAASVNSPHSS